MKKELLIIFCGIVLMAILVGCGSARTSPPTVTAEKTGLSPGPISEPTSPDWRSFPLTDVSSGEAFKISDFAGKMVLVESFAVWCPVCTKQQQEIKKLHEENENSENEIISISLDTDPNEDEQKVLEAVQERGFTWRFAVSPAELTKLLIDEFGPAIVNAPFAPVILVCENQSARLLGRGSKSAEELKAEIERGC